jgi:S-adenosylmethionine:tRNA ribosyltransferase-isomerase
VSAGTFLPVKHDNVLAHSMHEEQVVVTRECIDSLLSGRKVVAVGTTTMRTLESLYWYGCKLDLDSGAEFVIGQNDPYEINLHLPVRKSLVNVLKRMGSSDSLHGRTSIFIRPGYDFKMCTALVTNFHQPGSTLILLVAAFAGPSWREIYDQALTHGYRFLSYGDSSFIFGGKSL